MAIISFALPRIPDEPAQVRTLEDLRQAETWFRDLRRELADVLTDIYRVGATKSLVGYKCDQTVAAGFTIQADGITILLTAAGPVTSSLTKAITDGADGQWAIIVNVGAQAITVAHGANVKITAGVDLALTQWECLHVVWAGTTWVEVNH